VSNCPAEKIFAGSKKVRTGSYMTVQPAWLNSEETEMGRRFKWSENKIKEFQAEGRGKGSLASYLPWVQVSDFSSLGNSRRVFSNKTGRVHHLMSDVEWQFFLLLEFSPDITDIREQYPLPREETLGIAAQLGIRHPTYPGTAVPTVMTCDFLAIRKKGSTNPVVEFYDCKRTQEAEDRRSLEKLEISRTYCDGIESSHRLVFSSMLPSFKVRNLEWIYSAELKSGEAEPHTDYFANHCERLYHDLASFARTGSLAQYCDNYDARVGAIPGTGLRAIRMLIRQHLVRTDLNQPDLAAAPVSMFRVDPGRRQSIGGA
jgi:hypothetical protein